MEKSCGVLCHITSLPNKLGQGCFSKEAYKFVDILSDCGVSYWQVLPFNPANYDGSPFQSCSLFAGNPLLIDLTEFNSEEEIINYYKSVNIDFLTSDFKIKMEARLLILNQIFDNYVFSDKEKQNLDNFKKQNQFWLNDYAVYMALMDYLKVPLSEFPENYLSPKSNKVLDFCNTHQKEIKFYIFVQFIFFKQWKKLKNYAKKKNIKIIGDIPIYVALDSADLWAHREQFLTDKYGNLSGVAGVPPDYFCEDGQLWGNPLYDYAKMKRDKFSWWIKRLKHTSKFFDVIKLDHFRGFSSFWKIRPGSLTAKEGVWVKGGGKELFTQIKKQVKAQLILEDLGIIDRAVVSLRKFTGYPGMRVYQFGFDGNEKNPHLPQNYIKNCVAYIGTHDNDTFIGFLSSLKPKVLWNVKCDLNLPDNSTYEIVTEKAIEKILASKSNLVIVTVQDILQLGTEYRMNTPGTVGGNWNYQMENFEKFSQECNKLKKIIKLNNR